MVNARRCAVAVAVAWTCGAAAIAEDGPSPAIAGESPVGEAAAASSEQSFQEADEADLVWHDNYGVAYRVAKETQSLLLINFVPTEDVQTQQQLEAAIANTRIGNASCGITF